ncbi:MAG: hypothetical protein JW910_03440 [Anaerolineae bacterium]|nr:hypothetical protein [Anaerolineae bacterium]
MVRPIRARAMYPVMRRRSPFYRRPFPYRRGFLWRPFPFFGGMWLWWGLGGLFLLLLALIVLF